MLNNTLNIHKVESKSPLTLEDQQRFWRRLHHNILLQGNLQENRKSGVWVDVLYRPDQPWEVYFSASPEISPYLSKWFQRSRKRGNKLEVDFTPTDHTELAVPSVLTICELKLAFDNLFALPTYSPSLLPKSLPLKSDEKARISFWLKPIPAVMWNHHKHNLFKSKMEDGIRTGRGRVEATGWLRVFLYYIGIWMGRFLPIQSPSVPDVTWLSQETLRKLNDCHFETVIRIAAPQRLIPRLARPFQGDGGENQLMISFMPRKEEKSARKEINRHRLSFFTRSDLNPNILGSREISNLLSFFPNAQKLEQDKASPNL